MEQVLKAPGQPVTPRPLVDYSAHQLIEHGSAKSAGSGLGNPLGTAHNLLGNASLISLAASHTTLTSQRHSLTSSPGADHLALGVAKAVAWHKPYCT
jgi:hypothetical protein